MNGPDVPGPGFNTDWVSMLADNKLFIILILLPESNMTLAKQKGPRKEALNGLEVVLGLMFIFISM